MASAAAAQPYRIEATAADLTVQATGQTVFSAQSWAEDQRRAFVRANAGRPLNCDYEHRLTALSLVGSRLGLRDEFAATCPPEAHPSEETRLLTLDLAAPPATRATPVLLTSAFPSDAIRLALAAAPTLHGLLPGGPPRTLGTLVDALRGKNGTGPDDCFTVPSDLLTRFAIVGAEPAHAVVTVGLPGAGLCRDNLTELRLALPPPPPLAAALRDAQFPENPPAVTITLTIGRGASAQ